jgi:hypothetical protein
MVLGIMPLLSIYILCQKKEFFENEKFERNWGAFFEGLSTKFKANMYFNFMFILRRLIFFFTAFFLYSKPIV